MKYIIGTGGFAREVYFLLEEMGIKHEFGGFLEPGHVWKEEFASKKIYGYPILHQEDFNADKDEAIIGISDPLLRKKVTTQLPPTTVYPSIIHPKASVSNYAQIGEGAIITAGVIVTVDIIIGKQCQLNLLTTIGHDCVIGDFFTTAPSANISGICNFGDFVYFGTNSAVRQGITICSNVTIGMGANVVKHITEPGVYVGSPAQRLVR